MSNGKNEEPSGYSELHYPYYMKYIASRQFPIDDYMGKNLEFLYQEAIPKLCKFFNKNVQNYGGNYLCSHDTKKDSSCMEVCDLFTLFEESEYLSMVSLGFIVRTKEDLSSRKRIEIEARQPFLRYLVKLMRERALNYKELAMLFGISYDRCRIMVGDVFAKCCLDKKDCVYGDILREGVNKDG